MPRYAPNKMPLSVKKRYFELLREGCKGAAAARVIGVSASCGSNWFLDAGGMIVPDRPVSSRFLCQDDRIAIADGLHSGRNAKEIAASIGKSFQTVYREIKRGSKPDGRYEPFWAHNQALLRRRRPKDAKIAASASLRVLVRNKLTERWSPQQVSRFLARAYPENPAMRACPETIYRALFAGLLGRPASMLRTRRTRRRRQRRGVPNPSKIKNMKLIHQRPLEVNERRTIGHWEGDLIIGCGQASAVGTLAALRGEPHFRYAARQDWDKIARALKPIYTASNQDVAEERFLEFQEAWGGKYPAIIKLWSDAWAEFVPFLRFDVEIRKVVCSTNAIESVNARIRKAVRARGHFPNEAAAMKCIYMAAMKCIYMALMSLDPTGKGRKRWTMRWKAPLNAFQIEFEGRLTPTTN